MSGGFTRIIDHIKQHFNLDYGFANMLEMKNAELTGRILGEILDGHQKRVILREIAHKENILPELNIVGLTEKILLLFVFDAPDIFIKSF